MKPFFAYRTTRFTATVMLFVWLLALGTGIANACLVQENHARHGHLGYQGTVVTAMPAAAPGAMAVSHDVSPGKMACQNFCAAEQTGVVKQQDDAPGHLDAALVLASMWWVAPSPADRAFTRPVLGDPAWAEPPVFIRFLRLTL